MKNTIFHIDVNSAFLSWEAVDRLSKGEKLDLRTVPSIVGGDPIKRRGIVLAKSLLCKPYGIQTAETVHTAMQKCPNLVVVPPRYEVYTRASKALQTLLGEYTDKVEQYSIDESFLQADTIRTKHDNPIDLADEIRNRIEKELGFTVCVGISENKLLAKIATDIRKPNFTTTLYKNELEKMWRLPVSDLFMVGFQTAPKLYKLGIRTIGDLAKYDYNTISSQLKSHGRMIWRYANGIDESRINTESIAEKGMGNSTTIPYDVSDLAIANKYLLSLCENVGARLRGRKYIAQVVSISIRFSDFSHISRQHKMWTPINSTTEIYNNAKLLLADIWKNKPIRHIGVRVTDLGHEGQYQTTLFDAKIYEKHAKLDKMVDEVRGKYGKNSVQRACFAGTDIKPIQGGVEADDCMMMKSNL